MSDTEMGMEELIASDTSAYAAVAVESHADAGSLDLTFQGLSLAVDPTFG
ncbi:MAG: hypothetical protein R3C05_31580 [Pirellulaceae bacterium]